MFKRPKWMLDRAFADSRHVRRVAQPDLHLFQYCLMLPAPTAPLLARRALRFHGAALTL